MLALAGAADTYAQKARPLPGGETVLRAIEERWASIKDYAVSLTVTADIERLDVPPMVVRMYFKQPDKTHFESEGFAVLPRDALRFNPRTIRERFAVEGVTWDSAGTKLRLRLISRGETGPVRRLTLLVDPVRHTIDGMESGTSDNRRMKAVFTHTDVDGFLLPASLVVEFVSDAPPEGPDLQRATGTPRQGKVTILFSDYVVNGGLSEELFGKKDE
jgi:hypothetical protein